MINLSVDTLKKFSKEELIYYLKKIEFYIPSGKTDSIEYCILNKRYEEIRKEENNIWTKISEALEEYKKTQDFNKLIEVQKLNKERDRIEKKQRKIEKELWGI